MCYIHSKIRTVRQAWSYHCSMHCRLALCLFLTFTLFVTRRESPHEEEDMADDDSYSSVSGTLSAFLLSQLLPSSTSRPSKHSVGRRREHPVWDYFTYDESTDTSRCSGVITMKDTAGNEVESLCPYNPSGIYDDCVLCTLQCT